MRSSSSPLRIAATLSILLLGLVSAVTAAPQKDPAPVRYVRVELTGEKRFLSLAEVQVFRNGRNLAVNGSATQIDVENFAPAGRAIDGNWDGDFNRGSVTHTTETTEPWWELDLGTEQIVDQITIWNRTDCCSDRLEGFRLALLNEKREVVWSVEKQRAPSERVDYSLWGAPLIQPKISIEERNERQEAINEAIDRGVDWLLDRQLRDGSWAGHADSFRSGQTALSMYALLKCGVPRTHPAVERALLYIQHNPPVKTYAVSCLLMALEALGNPEHRPWMEEQLEQLLDWQGAPGPKRQEPGMWAYPDSVADLSNTQYAALGLRAAHKAGLEIPTRAWQRLLDNTLQYQTDSERVESTTGEGRTTTGMEIAGFRYRRSDNYANATGSMTTAGVSIVQICLQGLGDKLGRGPRREAEQAMQRGVNWLDYNFAVDKNPGMGGRLHYYLYGLERVGALLGMDYIGSHDWYWEGARFLIKDQRDDGWHSDEGTCFGLLFLAKATASATGPNQSKKANARIVESVHSDVHWRLIGDQELSMWITGFNDEVLNDFVDPDGEVKGLRVVKVEYLCDKEVVASIEGDPTRAWDNDRFAARYTLPAPGEYWFEVQVTIIDPYVQAGNFNEVLVGEELVVNLTTTFEEWMLDYPVQGKQNLLRGAKPKATASSENNDGQGAAKAVDGFHGTHWLCAKDEANPTLTIELGKPARANLILLSQVNAHAKMSEAHDRVTRVRMWINRSKEPIELELDPDERRKTVHRLSKRQSIRLLRIEIVEREPGITWSGLAGLAEIELLSER